MSANKGAPEVLRYHASGGLQTILSVTFFLILLFMANSLAGAIWLVTHNLQADALIFGLMFATGAVLLFYAGLFLFAASHSEVHLTPDKAVMVLPNWRGPTPLFPYSETEASYKDLAAVETRGEVYRYFIMPVIVQSACLVRKDGKRLTLGYVREHAEDPWMPFPEIAAKLAERAGVPVVHKGIVEANKGLHAVVQDEPAWDAAPLAEERLAQLRRIERMGWTALVVVFALVAVAALGFQASRFLG
jgi:hypothetical protein